MAETVFILGAGASRRVGVPLIGDFLDRGFDLAKQGDLGAAETTDFDLVRRGRDELQRAHSKATLDINNLEAVLDAFEMAALVGRLGDLDAKEVGRLPEAMRTLITVTLERLVELPASAGTMKPCPVYESFVRLVAQLRHRGISRPTVITLNYDLCVDYASYTSISCRSAIACRKVGARKI